MAKRTVQDRFWSKIKTFGAKPGECWEWDGAQTSGYGNFDVGGRRYVRAHRFAYELTVGPIPPGLTLDHLCMNRVCVNPAHLEPVTLAENLSRAAAAITHCPAGHEYTYENTSLTAKGYRQCRACWREKKRKKRGYQGLVYGGQYCRNGHEYTPENTRLERGNRVCRACVRTGAARRRAARRLREA